LPVHIQVLAGSVALVAVWFVANGLFQVIKKPTELFFPVSGVLYKTPRETWEEYAPLFERHSTHTIRPEFLAALAQVEGSGNPIVRTYWRWSLSADPFDVYRPASSAVGMYQITDGTFEEARRYCVHDHVVVEDGPWHAWRSCWLNALYSRVVPSHAVEMTSAYLDRQVTRTLVRRKRTGASAQQRQNLAAVIHLCGAGAGDAYARRGLALLPGQRCGDHVVADYLTKVNRAAATFAALAATERER
jgi:hypothetical protein